MVLIVFIMSVIDRSVASNLGEHGFALDSLALFLKNATVSIHLGVHALHHMLLTHVDLALGLLNRIVVWGRLLS